MSLPGVRTPLSLWCSSVPHKLLVKVFSKFIEFGLNSAGTESKDKTAETLSENLILP